MLRLYDSTTSGNCYKVRLLLAHLELPYETIAIDVTSRDPRPPALLRDNPLGKVPKLELEDGRALVESNAILWDLAAGTPYLPPDRERRTEVIRWLFFEQNAHEPNIAVLRFLLLHLPESEQMQEVNRFLRRRGVAALDAMELQLTDRPFLVDDGYTISDIALYAYTHVAAEGGFDLEGYPRIREWLARVRDQPRHVPLAG